MLALKTMNAVHKRRGTYPQLYILKYILSKLSTINFQLNHKEVISKGIIVFLNALQIMSHTLANTLCIPMHKYELLGKSLVLLTYYI